MNIFDGGKTAREESAAFLRARSAKREQARHDAFMMAALTGLLANGAQTSEATIREALWVATACLSALQSEA